MSYSLVLTCPLGLESVAKKEIELLWLKIIEVQDKQLTIEYSPENLVKLNLWSRIWNRVYIEFARAENINTFDKLYNLIWEIDWKNIVTDENPVVVNATSKSSTLESVPAIQKIGKKSIVDKITAKKDLFLRENDSKTKLQVEIVILKNVCQILLNTSWEPLHKRWYRKESNEAPIRENIAAGLVFLSSWRYKENFFDLFCWSWTIVIEAALIAKNIAPGLYRNFLFEDFSFIDLKEILRKERELAKIKIIDKSYNIYAADIDEESIRIAKDNAFRAWVADIIQFETNDFMNYIKYPMTWTLVSNPPYWIRLNSEDLDALYKNLGEFYKKNKELWWWIITNYHFWEVLTIPYKKRKLYNWWEMCYFYKVD